MEYAMRAIVLSILLAALWTVPVTAQEYESERLRLVLMAVDAELDKTGEPAVPADRREAVALCTIARIPSRWIEQYPSSRLSDREAFEVVMRGTRTAEEREAMDRLATIVVEGVQLCALGSASVPVS
jgi:hypothetical protein